MEKHVIDNLSVEIFLLNYYSLNMSSADAEELDENAELIEGILNEDIPFDILRFERDVPEVDEIEEFFKFYCKHADTSSKKHDDIVKTLDYQIFEVIHVIVRVSILILLRLLLFCSFYSYLRLHV